MTIEIMQRIKCSKCKVYLAKNVLSDICLACSKKQILNS